MTDETERLLHALREPTPELLRAMQQAYETSAYPSQLWVARAVADWLQAALTNKEPIAP